MKSYLFALFGAVAAASAGEYRVAGHVPIGGAGSYDYVRFDSAGQRLFVSHQTRVEVVDARTGKVVGALTGLKGVHGIALAPDLGRGYVSNGLDGTVTVFGLADLAVQGSIRTGGEKPDAIEFDPASGLVVVSNGHSNSESLIEAASGQVKRLIKLAGNPESIAFDGRGHALVNLESHNSVAQIDLATGTVTADWPVAPGEGPTGIAIDPSTRRLFVSCGGNEKMVILDADSGQRLADLPIGDDSDGAAFDAGLKRAYSSNRDGTLTVVQEDSPTAFRVLENLPTQRGAKTLAVDPATHRVFLPVAELAPGKDEDHPGPAVPGSFQVLVAQPGGLVLQEKSPPVRATDAPALVWDLAPDVAPAGFRNFRTTSDALKAKGGAGLPDLRGFAALHESGSSEFSTAGFHSMMGKFTGHVVDFDLRQEDHGFLNGQPVSWFATNNWANVGQAHEVIVADEGAKLSAFTAGSSVVVTDDSVKKTDAGNDAPKTTVKLDAAETERQVVEAAGASYVRLTVTDHARPTDAEVDRFVIAVRDLPSDAWAHFHCRAGRGRTTTFMALYDMLRNAPQVTLAAIVERQSLAAGDYDLLGKEKEAGAKEGVATDRANFVRAFYRYAQQNPNGQPQLWTEWLAAQ